MICQGTHPSQPGELITIGGFCQNKFPSHIELVPDQEYIINHTDGDFLFANLKNKWTSFHQKTYGPMLEVITDYEHGGFISLGAHFLSLTYSYDYQFNMLSKSELAQI